MPGVCVMVYGHNDDITQCEQSKTKIREKERIASLLTSFTFMSLFGIFLSEILASLCILVIFKLGLTSKDLNR